MDSRSGITNDKIEKIPPIDRQRFNLLRIKNTLNCGLLGINLGSRRLHFDRFRRRSHFQLGASRPCHTHFHLQRDVCCLESIGFNFEGVSAGQ